MFVIHATWPSGCASGNALTDAARVSPLGGTPTSVKKTLQQNSEVKVASPTPMGDTCITPKSTREEDGSHDHGRKPPKHLAPVPPSPPYRPRRNMARMTTGGEPPKRPTIPGIFATSAKETTVCIGLSLLVVHTDLLRKCMTSQN
jgi:hypothetical protein